MQNIIISGRASQWATSGQRKKREMSEPVWLGATTMVSFMQHYVKLNDSQNVRKSLNCYTQWGTSATEVEMYKVELSSEILKKSRPGHKFTLNLNGH
jgi:hypothetical protein